MRLVSTDSMEAIRRELALELPGQRLKVTSENGIVFLRGTVKDLNSSARAVQIAATGGGKVVNLLNVDVPTADPQILLKVRFASVDRSKEKQLGINVFSYRPRQRHCRRDYQVNSPLPRLPICRGVRPVDPYPTNSTSLLTSPA